MSKCSAWSLSVGVNAYNQITTPSGYSYDAAGNTTADATYTYSFDAESRIITASGMSGGPYCYTYDGNGVRVAKSNANGGSCTGSPTVDVLYWRAPSGDAIAETDGTGSTSNSNYHEYVFFAGRRIARSDPSSSNVYFYFADQLGTTRSVTQANGTVCFAADYFPYGEEVDYTTSCPQNYKFTGYERDAETGLDYAFKRHYNSRMARFMSADSWGGAVGAPQSHNAYSYVVNNPVVLVDRFGACPGGFAENRDNNRDPSQDSVSGGGPFQPDGDFEAADPGQTPGMHWRSTPGPCPGFSDQGGGGGIGVNNFATLDYMDIGQVPSVLLGWPGAGTGMGSPSGPFGSSDANNVYFGFGLGFGTTMENGPFGAYFNPGSGCYATSASSGWSCVNTDERIFQVLGHSGLFKFSEVFGQLWPPGTQAPPTSFTLLPDLGNSPPPTAIRPKKLPLNPPPGPGNPGPTFPPCNSTTTTTPGVPTAYVTPMIGSLFLALPSVTLLQEIPGLTCSP